MTKIGLVIDYCSMYPSSMIMEDDKMMRRIGVSVVEEKDGKVKERYVETDTLLSATRIMNTWKVTRGYEVIQFRVEEVGRLI